MLLLLGVCRTRADQRMPWVFACLVVAFKRGLSCINQGPLGASVDGISQQGTFPLDHILTENRALMFETDRCYVHSRWLCRLPDVFRRVAGLARQRIRVTTSEPATSAGASQRGPREGLKEVREARSGEGPEKVRKVEPEGPEGTVKTRRMRKKFPWPRSTVDGSRPPQHRITFTAPASGRRRGKEFVVPTPSL